ncbi:MAG: NAD+ synthase [Planctomycetota bacterium]
MKLSLVQFNPTVGALAENARAIERLAREAAAGGADLIVFPELALCGYPPRDLLIQGGFMRDAHDEAVALAERMRDLGDTVVLVGAPWQPGAEPGRWDTFDPRVPKRNSLLVMRGGSIVDRYDKRLLPTYDVFDEDRYFAPGERAKTLDVAGVHVGLTICEDLWRGGDAGTGYSARYALMPDPVADLIDAGARVIVNPSGSPMVVGKGARQREILTRHVEAHGVTIAAVNQVGGNDDLIFDGHAAVYVPGADGGARLVAAGRGFEEQIVTIDLNEQGVRDAPSVADPLLASSEDELRYRALVLGVRDYLRKTGFTSACLGLSGGIDSALTCAIAARAIGAENVLGVAMPSRYSSEHSVTDAVALAENLGVRYHEVPIRAAHELVEGLMAPAYADLGIPGEPDITEENIQSRLRGLIMMAISNKSGALLLTTGNKSELAVGYCTLYGDMNGGLAVLSDTTKEEVYAMSRWINANHEAAGFARAPIPDSTITKPPSAELREDQTDQDTLPPYDVLDDIIERYVERLQDTRTIVDEGGHDPEVVARIVRLIDVNEHKRKQLAIGLKVSSIAFGRGRRRPIAQGYRPDRSVSPASSASSTSSSGT